MAFLDNLGTLITQNVNFNDDQLETLVETLIEKTTATATAGVEFVNLAGDNAATTAAGESLVSLAGEIGTAFPHLTAEQADRFKGIVANVYDNPDPAVDAAAQKVFDTAVDSVVAAQAVSDYVASTETDTGTEGE